MLAQPPDIGFVTSQTGAVDTALLTGTDTDSLSVLHIAYRVRLSVLQGDEGDNQVALGLCCKSLVLGGNVLKQCRVVEFNLIASLFESDTKHLFALDGLRLIAGINLNHIISTLTLILQNLDCLRSIVGSNHTVAHLTLQNLRCGSVASVRQGYEVTIRRHTVGTTGTGISAGNRTLVQSLNVIHEIDVLQRVRQRQSNGSTGRTHVLERSSSWQTCCSLQLLHQLPGIEGIQEIDVARTTVNHFDG